MHSVLAHLIIGVLLLGVLIPVMGIGPRQLAGVRVPVADDAACGPDARFSSSVEPESGIIVASHQDWPGPHLSDTSQTGL